LDGSGSGLTEFLLDLTEDEKLSEAFQKDPDPIIESRGLTDYGDLLKSGDVEGLRRAVRVELTGEPSGGAVEGVMRPPDGDEEPEAIIAGVRIPGVREPPIPGVMEADTSGEAVKGVMEPGPPDSA
jgi:hypothetical protein